MKTSKEWEKIASEKYNLVILDADGWDRRNFEYSFNEELISSEEFLSRVANSTISCSLGLFNIKNLL